MRSEKRIWRALGVLVLTYFLGDHGRAASNERTSDMDGPFLVLSEGSPFLRAGVFIDTTNHTILIRGGQAINKGSLAMVNTSTNAIYIYSPRRVQQRLDVSMRDSTGAAVEKTSTGKQFGEPLSPPPPLLQWKHHGLEQDLLLPNTDALYNPTGFAFPESLTKCFHLEKPGNYWLSLVQRVYIVNVSANSPALKPLVFPPVTVKVIVENEQRP